MNQVPSAYSQVCSQVSSHQSHPRISRQRFLFPPLPSLFSSLTAPLIFFSLLLSFSFSLVLSLSFLSCVLLGCSKITLSLTDLPLTMTQALTENWGGLRVFEVHILCTNQMPDPLPCILHAQSQLFCQQNNEMDIIPILKTENWCSEKGRHLSVATISKWIDRIQFQVCPISSLFGFQHKILSFCVRLSAQGRFPLRLKEFWSWKEP